MQQGLRGHPVEAARVMTNQEALNFLKIWIVVAW